MARDADNMSDPSMDRLGQKWATMSARAFRDYRPCELSEGASWRITFYVLDPTSGNMKRFRKRVKEVKGIAKRRQLAKQMMAEIDSRLSDGWNPLSDSLVGKRRMDVAEAGRLFLEHHDHLRPDTLRGYRSLLNAVERYSIEAFGRVIMVTEWTKNVSIAYLTWIRRNRHNTPRTHNNHLMFHKQFWNWMMDFDIALADPWTGFKKLKVSKKMRVVVPPYVREMVADYFREHDRAMLLVCMLVFSVGLRRTELCRLRVGDIDMDTGVIRIPPAASKVGEFRSPTLPKYVQDEIGAYLGGTESQALYLFGKGIMPSSAKLRPDTLTDHWRSMRAKLELPKEYQLYSLRDSGIEWMFENGHDAQTIMHQFGHTDLSTTTKYSVRVNPRTADSIRALEAGF
jgi:integrase